ncbi:bifunctional phosphoglucose/phosphomannose isomerase [Candidatus Bathyarchaeota archaeon]|nr:MAG: bifunctional phosphoglucose/phosphomannose isomerase [Candidatus Bathyarchaeota archaeon]
MEETLDNLSFIESIDKSKMAESLEKTPEHYEKALQIAEELELEDLKNRKILKVAFLGMGGSSIGGSIFKDWSYEKISVPVEICRDSIIPKHLDKHTLVFAVSYSGNTKETLDAFLQALERKCLIVGVSSGGLLGEYCKKHNVLHVQVPTGFQPRLALPYLFTVPCVILEKVGVVEGFKKEISDAIMVLKELREEIKTSVSSISNETKKLALNLKGKIPIIYGFREYGNVAYRLKTQLNENSKTFCKFDVLPELNHNEIVGWEEIQPSVAKLLSVILLRDKEEPEDIRIRFEVLKEILTQKTVDIREIYGRGREKLAKMLSIIYIGDYLSFYLAILNRVDPTPVKTISFLKKELEKRLGKINIKP